MRTEYEALTSVFLNDADQQLSHMETAWQALSDGSSEPECREKIVRGAHTIKGNAAMMGLPEWSEFAGKVEYLAKGLRYQAGPAGTTVLLLLRECIDRLHQMVRRLEAGQGEQGPSERALLTQIECLSAKLHGYTRP